MPSPRNHLPLKQPRLWLSLFLLSAATLTFEINLTRPLLGRPVLPLRLHDRQHRPARLWRQRHCPDDLPRPAGEVNPSRRLAQLALAAGLSILVAYLLTNWLPFDSFSLLVDSARCSSCCCTTSPWLRPSSSAGMALGFSIDPLPPESWRCLCSQPVRLCPRLCHRPGCAIRSGRRGHGDPQQRAGCAGSCLLHTRLHPLKHPLRLGVAALLFFSLLDLGLRLTGQPWSLCPRTSPLPV